MVLLWIQTTSWWSRVSGIPKRLEMPLMDLGGGLGWGEVTKCKQRLSEGMKRTPANQNQVQFWKGKQDSKYVSSYICLSPVHTLPQFQLLLWVKVETSDLEQRALNYLMLWQHIYWISQQEVLAVEISNPMVAFWTGTFEGLYRLSR